MFIYFDNKQQSIKANVMFCLNELKRFASQ